MYEAYYLTLKLYYVHLIHERAVPAELMGWGYGEPLGRTHLHGTDGRPMALVSRASGLGCPSSMPSVHYERHKRATGRQQLPQHVVDVLLHKRPDR